MQSNKSYISYIKNILTFLKLLKITRVWFSIKALNIYKNLKTIFI